MTGPELKQLGVIDEIVPEPVGGAYLSPEIVFRELEQSIATQLAQLNRYRGAALAADRYQKFGRMGMASKKEEP